MDTALLQPGDYLQLLKLFVDKGEVLSIEKDVPYPNHDPILDYLSEIMNNPLIQAKVLSSRLAGKIFYETVGRFVLECMHEVQFANQRTMGERGQIEKTREWAMQKKRDNWQSLLSAIKDKHEEDGFDIDFLKKRFMNDGWEYPENWDLLRHEWKGTLDRQIQRKVTQHLEKKKSLVAKGLDKKLSHMQQLRNEGVSEEQALQAWNLLEGQ